MPLPPPPTLFRDLADAVLADAQAVGGPVVSTTVRDAVANYAADVASYCMRNSIRDYAIAIRDDPNGEMGRKGRWHARELMGMPLPQDLVLRYLVKRGLAVINDDVAYSAHMGALGVFVAVV